MNKIQHLINAAFCFLLFSTITIAEESKPSQPRANLEIIYSGYEYTKQTNDTHVLFLQKFDTTESGTINKIFRSNNGNIDVDIHCECGEIKNNRIWLIQRVRITGTKITGGKRKEEWGEGFGNGKYKQFIIVGEKTWVAGSTSSKKSGGPPDSVRSYWMQINRKNRL